VAKAPARTASDYLIANGCGHHHRPGSDAFQDPTARTASAGQPHHDAFSYIRNFELLLRQEQRFAAGERVRSCTFSWFNPDILTIFRMVPGASLGPVSYEKWGSISKCIIFCFEEGIPSSSSAQCSKSNNNLGIMCTAEAQQRQGVWYV
jgi:hypothetical protein